MTQNTRFRCAQDILKSYERIFMRFAEDLEDFFRRASSNMGVVGGADLGVLGG